MTKKAPKYTEAFKAEAIKKIQDNNDNISATAREIDVPMQTLSNWHKEVQAGKLKGTDKYDPKLIAALEEIKQLKRQLKIAEEEREILKKATAYFAKVSK